MGRKRRNISEYRGMWLFVMFDLPTDTKEARKNYADFRKSLISNGFSMLQFSVYARYFSSEESSKIYRKRIRAIIPPSGQVRLITVTDRQFGKMEVFYGKTRRQPENPPEQLMFF
ncbi:MAG: CRISPR-associated endonuclease Cas2 [Thermoproteales archaeon]|nr:CRISPR-associated endonuclease Cas2 [Thermoproteales archaeon]